MSPALRPELARVTSRLKVIHGRREQLIDSGAAVDADNRKGSMTAHAWYGLAAPEESNRCLEIVLIRERICIGAVA